MQTRKRWLSIILVLATFISVLFCTGMNVCAEAVTDGISVSVSSDKAEYDSGDEIKLEITVKNTNDFEVSNLKIENILPDGIKLVSGKAVEENVTLKADGEKTVKLSVAKANINSSTTQSTSSTPKTGESGIITILLAVLLIAGVIIVFALKGKKGFKFFSVVLCLCLIGQITPETLVNAQNSTSEDSLSSLTAECTYTIDGAEYLHKVVVSYDNIDSYIFNRVDIKLYETIVTDEFKNASLAERKEIASNLLNELEDNNLILKGSIKFNEEYNAYFFKYLNGAEGSILISEAYSINNNNENDNTDVDVFELNPEIDLREKSVATNKINSNYIASGNSSSMGYIKDSLLKSNLKTTKKSAIIVDCMDDQSEARLNNAFKETWSSNNLITEVKSNVTVEDFKTILNGDGGYDFINIDAHGFIDFTGNPTIWLQEKQMFFDFTEYYEDRKSGRVGTSLGVFGGNYYLTAEFFTYYYSGELIDSIIWLSCCGSYTNDTLVSAFADKCNAKTVIGMTDTIAFGYDNRMRDFFVHKLLFGQSVNDALKESKSVYGNNDAEWLLNVYNKIDNTPAECKAYNGGNETLVELERLNNNGTLSGTVTDENGNPVKGAEIAINNIRGQSYETTAITDDNGKYTLECFADSYKITAKATGYSTFESYNFIDVVYGEETIYNITLKKASEEAPQLPAIVQTVYENEKMWLDDVNKLATEYDDATLGYNECWFQDLDMDGTPEFIVGGMGIYFSDFPSHVYHIYKYDNGALKRVEVNDDTANNNQYLMVMWGDNELNSGCDAFELLQTFKNESTGKYLHTIKSKHNYSDSSGAAISFSAYNMSGTKFKSDGDIVYCSIDGNGSIDGSYRVHTQNDETDENTFISTYDNYFADLTPYKTTIKAIPCSDESIDMPNNYDQMTADEKKQALLDSYNAWSFEVDTNAELPLESYINKLREAYNDEDETGTQYSAIDLINKTIPEIIDIMGGEYEVTEGPTSGDVYIYNHSTLPGIQLRVFIDWLRAWDNDSLNVKQIKEDLESGFYNDFWIEVHDNAFATPDISADMNYEECCSILGELECVTGTIGTGAPDSECYIFIEDDKQIELHFDRILDGNYIHSYDEMIQYNPHLICVLVKHENQG